MSYRSSRTELYNNLFERLETLAKQSPARALLVFETYQMPDGMEIWWRIRKTIFYAMCSFLLKKYKTGGELVAWARSEWESAAVKDRMFVQSTHHSAIQALEHDLTQWAIACSKGAAGELEHQDQSTDADIVWNGNEANSSTEPKLKRKDSGTLVP